MVCKRCGGCESVFPRFIREGAGLQYVALVLKVDHVEEKTTSTGKPYLLLHGNDIDQSRIEGLRIWRHGVSDVGSVSHRIFIIRGMKVDWYNGMQRPEACWCTALEDVTHSDVIQRVFRSL